MVNPLLGSLIDSFTEGTFNTAVWNGSSSVGSGYVGLGFPGSAFIQASTVFHIIKANGPYNASSQSFSAKVTPLAAGTGGTSATTYVEILADANDQVRLQVNTATGSFQASTTTGGTATTVNLPAYDPTQHAWWRLREVGGSWAFDTSPDGAAWTTLATIAYGWSPAAVAVQLSCGTSSGTLTGNAYFEHVNTPLGASTLLPSWPQVRFQVAFNTGGNMSTQPSYVDLSSRLRQSWSAELAGRQYELDQIQSGQMTCTLWNLDGALDPTNTASPYYPNVIPMRQCRLQAVWPPTRNLVPQAVSNATAAASQWFPFTGSVAPVSGLAPAPTGHATATAWTFPITSSLANQYPLVTGETGGNADPLSWPVVGGKTYTWSCWASRASGGDASLGITQNVLWYDQTGAQVGSAGATIASVPVQSGWAQNTISATAPATAVEARIGTWLTNTATTAVNTIYLTAMQFEQASAPTAWTAGGVVYPLWTGFVERWPQQWDFSGTYGMVDLTCIDVLAGLAQFTLQPNFQASLTALGPRFIYPFNDPAGSTSFADATGRNAPRIIGNSALGAGSGTVTPGSSVQGSGAVGVAGPVTTVSNSPSGSGTTSTGKFIATSANTFLPTSGGWTRIICFRTSAALPPTNQFLTLWASTGPAFWSGQSGSQGVFILGVNSSGNGFGWVTNGANTATSTVTVPELVVNDGNWHIIIAQLSADGKTFTVAVDNYGHYSTTTTDLHPSGCVTDGIGALEYRSIHAFQDAFAGDLAYATEFDYAIGNTAAYDLGSGFATGWAGEFSSARIQRILNMVQYPGAFGWEGSTVKMGGANLAGTDPVSAMTLVGDTEAGQVYPDSNGVLWLNGRLWRYLQPNPTIVFGENQAAGEVPYLGDLAMDFDTTHIYNVAQVSQIVAPGGTQPPDLYVTNAASEQTYLPRTVQRSINTYDPTLQQAAGQYLVSQYGQPLPRLSALNVDVAANPALLQQMLPVGFGTRAQVNRRPPSGPGAAAISVQQFVEHVTWNGDDQGNLKATLQLTPAGPYLNWWVAASLHTTVATASTAGTATVTLSALTGSATNPAAAVLVPGTQLTLSYGTANAETLTVKSVASTVAGYTSVAVTFTANTAFNHAVNDVVCQPLPANYAMPPATLASYPSSLDALATLSASGPRAAY
ncbi:hypothetical protein [Streptacidiphilus sp. MAP5-3]|uniref:hypothetical protein n=1 Tax=unclassified Streptacidiphilus TaxID=2643834 RepID=UPI0035143CBC